jgi:hypothetical protein
MLATPIYSWFWTVDGEPACESRHTLNAELDPPTRCGWTTREEAEYEAQRFLAACPGHTVAVRPREEHPRDPGDDYPFED